MKNKSWHLTIKKPDCPPQPTTLTLMTPSKKRGYCFKCRLEKEAWVKSEKPIGLSWEIKEFCWSCAFANLYELEQGDYQIAKKKEVIEEIRTALKKLVYSSPTQKSAESLECYAETN